MPVKLSSIKMDVPLLRTNSEAEFAKWWPLFKAYAIQKEFAPVLKQDKCRTLPATELPRWFAEGEELAEEGSAEGEDSSADKEDKGEMEEHTEEQKEALIQNKMAIAAFTIAFSKNENEDCQAYVTDSMTDEWPSGQCHLVVKELLDEFAADDEVGQIQQKVDLYHIEMEEHANPKTLFSQITSIEQRYKGRATPITDHDKRALILLKSPDMYKAIINNERALEKRLTGKEPTMKALRAAMYEHYKSMRINKANKFLKEMTLYAGGRNSDSETEDSIATARGNGKQKRGQYRRGQKEGRKTNYNNKSGGNQRRCYGCGAIGHIKRDCPLEKPKCSHCGKVGHTAAACWKKHPELRPKRRGGNARDMAGIVVEDELTFMFIEDTEDTEIPWSRQASSSAASGDSTRNETRANSTVHTNNEPVEYRTVYRGIQRGNLTRRRRGTGARRIGGSRFSDNQRRYLRPIPHDKAVIGEGAHGRTRPYQCVDRNGWPRAPANTYARDRHARESVYTNSEVTGLRTQLRNSPANGRRGTECACHSIAEETAAYNMYEKERATQVLSDSRANMAVMRSDLRDLEDRERIIAQHYRGRINKAKKVLQQARRKKQLNTHMIERELRDLEYRARNIAGQYRDKARALRNRMQQAKRGETALLNINMEMCLSNAVGTELLYTPVIWIADTGASCHVTNSALGAVPSVRAAERLRTMQYSLDASGNRMKTSAILDIKGTIVTKDGGAVNIVLKDCRYGASRFNLCSITKLTENGWRLRGDERGICLRKGSQQIEFNIPIKTEEGKLWAAKIQRRTDLNQDNEYTLATPTVMNLAKAHALCGHNALAETRRTARHLGWRITRTPFKRCEACAVAKARQANLTQGETNPPKAVGELYYVDGMRLKPPKRKHKQNVYFPTNNCLVMAVEHLTGAVHSGWYETKKGFVEDFCVFFNKQKEAGKAVRRIRCDDAGENKLLQKKINGESWRLNISFEYTAKTPQRNSRVETKLFHICNKTRAALEAANIPDQYRYVMFALFSKWCCQTDMLTVVKVNRTTKTKHEHLYGKLPKWINTPQVAGMAGVVKTHTKTTPKVDARGKTCLFVCYAEDHAKDCYVMYDPVTRKTLHSRDVLWLDRMYYPKRQRPGAPVAVEGIGQGSTCSVQADQAVDLVSQEEDTDTDLESLSDDSTGSAQESGDQDTTTVESSEDTNKVYRTRSGRASKAPMQHDGTRRGELVALHVEDTYIDEVCLLGVEEAKNTQSSNMDASLSEEEYILFSLTRGEKLYVTVETAFGYVNSRNEYMLVAAGLTDSRGELFLVGATGHNYGNTAELNVMNYKQAMATVDKEEWNKAIKVEHDKMVKYNVFQVVRPEEVPKGTKLFDSTWAMKKKPDGTFRARNAIRGFMQVDGEHYDSNDKSSPVATEVGIRVCFVLTIVGAWYQHLVDVEGAFLNGVFQRPDKHKIYMKVPEAYKRWYPSWAVFLLLKTQYGTVQAALQYYRECCKALAFLEFDRNKAEPCMFFKWKEQQLVIFVLWVDDCCISGPKHLVLEAVKEFTSLWDCKDLGQLEEYVGCKVERTKEWIRLTQPVKVQRFMDEFGCAGDNGPSNRAPSTPAEPGSVLQFDKEQEPAINQKRQTKYRSGVGILLHMMRWSRPDILNAVRELSVYMSVAGKACYKAMHRVMNYVVATKEKGYTFKPKSPAEWNGKKSGRKFVITGKCDSEYAKHSSRRSVNAGITYLEGAIVKQFTSKMMPIVALSTTEAELYSAVLTAQDMMFVYHIVVNMGLTVELPMKLYCDNKGAVDLANNWSVGGRTRHVDVKQHFLRELKENGIMEVYWQTGSDMLPDIHTKNVPKCVFDKYSQGLVS